MPCLQSSYEVDRIWCRISALYVLAGLEDLLMELTWRVSVDRMGPAFLSWAFVEEEVGDG